MQQSEKRNVRIHTQNFNDQINKAFRKYIAVNAQKPTVEVLTQEVIALCEDFYKQVGLPLYKHTDNIQIPQKLRDDFLLEEKMAVRITKDATSVMEALRNDSELVTLLSDTNIDPYSYRLGVNEYNYQLYLPYLITSSENDLIAKFYISSLKESEEYKALNHYVKAKFGADKNLENIDIQDLRKMIGYNDKAFESAYYNYKKVELATRICIQKAQVMSKELESNPEEKARYEKYLLSDAHKKHIQEFERVKGMSYVEHEALQLKALTTVVRFDQYIKEAVEEFVSTMSKENIDPKIAREAASIAKDRIEFAFVSTTICICLLCIAAIAPLVIIGSAFPPLFPIAIGIAALAAATIGVGGVIMHEVTKNPEKEKQKATENVLKSIESDSYSYSRNISNISHTANLVVGAMQELETKQNKSASVRSV